MSNTFRPLIRILRLGKSSYSGIAKFDFVEVPQGYIHVNETAIRKQKRVRKFPHKDGYLIDPTDEQVIDQAKLMMVCPDIYDQSSGKTPEDFNFMVTDIDFRDDLKKKQQKEWEIEYAKRKAEEVTA